MGDMGKENKKGVSIGIRVIIITFPKL